MEKWTKQLQSIQRISPIARPTQPDLTSPTAPVHFSETGRFQGQSSRTLAPRPIGLPSVGLLGYPLPEQNNTARNPNLGLLENTSSSTTRKQFFELCVNTGEFSIRLGEINLSKVKNDGDLFSAISAKYREIRGFRVRRILLKPVNIHFVRVSSPWESWTRPGLR